MPTAYIYRGTFAVHAGETLRYREVAADGTIGPEVTQAYTQLAGIGSLSVPAVSLTPTVAAPSLSGVQIGAIAGVSVSLRPTVSPAELSGVQVGSISAAAVTEQPVVAAPSVTGVQVGSIGVAAVTLRPSVAVGGLTGVEVASAPTPTPTISAMGGNTTVSIALTNSVSGATSWSIKWDTISRTGGGTYANTIDWATIQAGTPTFPAAPFVHTGLTNGTTYYYSLVATNAQGNTESAEVSAAGVPAAVTLAFESATITDSTGATWEKVTPSAVADGGVGVITSGVASVSGADGNCLSVKQSVYDDGNDFYAFDTFIRRTMDVAAGDLTLRVRRANSASAGWGYVKVGGTLYDLGFTTINAFVNKTLTIPAAQTSVVVEIGFTGGTAFLEGYIDSVSIPQ